MSYRPSPLHTYFNLYQVADTLMNMQINSPDLTIYDFVNWRSLEPYRVYLNSSAGREALTVWQETFQLAWQAAQWNYAIISQGRYATRYRLERYLLGSWQLSDLQYNYDSTDVQNQITSLETALMSLGRHVAKKLSKVT